MNAFITQNELSRIVGVPASRITAAVEAGLIQPAGRGGSHSHSPVLFRTEDVPKIRTILKPKIQMIVP